MKKFGQADKRF